MHRLSNYGIVIVIMAAYGVVDFIFHVNDGFAERRIGKATRVRAIAELFKRKIEEIFVP